MYFRIIVLITCLVLAMSSCGQDRAIPASTSASLRKCLVDLSDFPPGWSLGFGPDWYSVPGQILPGRARAGVSVDFSHGESSAVARHEILAYKTERRAADEFNRQQPATYFSASRLTPWQTPDGFSYASPVADQFRLACAEIDGHDQVFHLCIAMGQYGAHLSTFATWTSPDYMTYANLEQLLTAIDERMLNCAGMLVTNAPRTR